MTQPVQLSAADFRSRLAETLFEDEWRKADQTRDPARTRRTLRDRAVEVMEMARRTTSPANDPPTTLTAKPNNVEIAGEKDAAGLLALIEESDKELAIVPRDYDKVRNVIDLAVDRTPLYDADGSPFMRPVFGVVTTNGCVEAACGLFPTAPWDSNDFYLRGFFLYVSHAARRSTHAKALFQFSNWFSDRTSMAVVWEVINTRALDERSRLFLRHASPFGGIFIHRAIEQVAA